MLSSDAKWIWVCENPKPEEYACFKETFTVEDTAEKVILRISAETDYIAYVNGEVAAFSQFPGFPSVKYYDEINITDFCKKGENELIITVRYEGINHSAIHIEDGAGVIYDITSDGKTLAFSSEKTLCGYDGRYMQHSPRIITSQLGYSSGMTVGDATFDRNAVEMKKTYNLLKTPVEKTKLSKFEKGKSLGGGIYDLGHETAGYLYVKVRAKVPTDFKVSYGEHLADGCVRRKIGNRDFSLDFHTDDGEREFTQYFIRVACRYIQVECDDDLEVAEIGILHYLYPLTEKKTELSGIDKEIYETSVRTLRLCMNHHYEDCPWREQALYILDSRNQMLCGYCAFQETQFQRENILFMLSGVREDGFFELTFPSDHTPSIPFFSVMYPVLVYEYIEHTGDKEILGKVMDRIKTIMENTYKRVTDKGIVCEFERPFWNFYEWSDGSDGADYWHQDKNSEDNEKKYHLILNCAFVYAGERYKKLCEMAGNGCNIDFEAIKRGIEKTFFDAETGLFANTPQKDSCSQLGNAFAVLIGLGDERTTEALKNSDTLIPATLSMIGYVYDALLDADFDANKDYVLDDIRRKYGYMLEKGATSFWETILGEADFGGAGSLCHGWSGMPVYYYNKLGLVK